MTLSVNVLCAVSVPALAALALVVAAGCCGSSGSPQRADGSSAVAPASASPSGETAAPAGTHTQSRIAAPAAGAVVRVGGDMGASITGASGDYRSGPCRIDTPLPVGYPEPTPPGAIDLKTYPSVRLAEVGGSGNPDRGMNRTFWPLFNHIKKHDIAMTSPVEMRYAGMGSDAAAQPQAWSMAFLYRTPEMNATGVEGAVTVRDAEPVTVLAVGLKGDYSMSLVERGRRLLEEWLAANPGWELAGDWRSLYYNGPSLLFWNKWAEVQVPVRPAAGGASASAAGGR